ncbi:hypothetical protein [Kitasatospora sp. NPDC094015]|uniref:hypothetical protein n=1 Tax=Kitasatospora sp. NPDC094015 TaxID=3155205 RepID=UPI003323F631
MTARRTLAATALLLLTLAGCGIRPTAVPVDAGAPASRTACPTVPRVPSAPSVPSPPAVTAAPGPRTARPSPSVTPGAGASPSAGLFSASPTPVPSAAPCS